MNNGAEEGSGDGIKVVALIPCYREAEHVGDVVRRVRQQLRDVLVIDDGSPDDTASIAREAGAEVIIHAKNAGKGAAIKTGLRALMEREIDYVILLDGDGQHLPEEIGNFLAAGVDRTAGLFVGNRMRETASMPVLRRFTNLFMSAQISRLCRQHVPDTQCGFRMVRRDSIPTFFCESNGYDYETEMLLVASRKGQRIVSVPISTVYAGEKSKIRPVLDGIRFLKLLWHYRRG